MMSCTVSPSPHHNHRVFFPSPPRQHLILSRFMHQILIRAFNTSTYECTASYYGPEPLRSSCRRANGATPQQLLLHHEHHPQRPHQMRELCRPFVHTCSTYQRIVILNHKPNTQPWTSPHPLSFSPLTSILFPSSPPPNFITSPYKHNHILILSTHTNFIMNDNATTQSKQ